MALKTPIQIDGRGWSLFKDYDKPNYIYLTPDGKVEYLARRGQLILLDPLQEIKQTIREKNTEEYYWLCVVTLVCCGIEATGGYLIGRDGKTANKKGTNRKAFEKFIQAYMPEYWPYARDLWKFFRNGLAHGFCISKGSIELNLPQRVQRTTTTGVQINADEFVDAFASGFLKYIQDIKNTPAQSKMRKKFNKTWDWVFMS